MKKEKEIKEEWDKKNKAAINKLRRYKKEESEFMASEKKIKNKTILKEL